MLPPLWNRWNCLVWSALILMLSSPVCSVVGHLQYQGRPSKACMHWQFPVVPTDSRGLLVWLMKARHMIMFFGCPPTAGSLALGMYSKGYLSCLAEELQSECSEMRDNFKTNKIFKREETELRFRTCYAWIATRGDLQCVTWYQTRCCRIESLFVEMHAHLSFPSET